MGFESDEVDKAAARNGISYHVLGDKGLRSKMVRIASEHLS